MITLHGTALGYNVHTHTCRLCELLCNTLNSRQVLSYRQFTAMLPDRRRIVRTFTCQPRRPPTPCARHALARPSLALALWNFVLLFYFPCHFAVSRRMTLTHSHARSDTGRHLAGNEKGEGDSVNLPNKLALTILNGVETHWPTICRSVTARAHKKAVACSHACQSPERHANLVPSTLALHSFTTLAPDSVYTLTSVCLSSKWM